MNGWKEAILSDIVELIGGGTPKTSNPNYWNGNIPWLSVADFNTGKKYIYDTEKKISVDGLKNSSTKLLQKGDIIISARGTVGVVAVLNREMAFNQSCYGIRSRDRISITDFVYYLLKDAVLNLKQISHGGVFDTITQATFKEIAINLPPLPEQKAIAEVLSSLDDKIDLLHRQNKTLEEMAETLFRHWFIEERDEGWEERELGNYFPVITGKKNANYSTDEGKYPFFTCSQNNLSAPDYSFNAKAILLAGNGDFSLKRYSGKFEAYQRTYVLIPFEEKYHNFLYVLMKYHLSDITGGHRGSVINFITKGMIKDFKIKIQIEIPEEKLSHFDRIYYKVDYNSTQLEILSSIRDTLLPKLMSGEVRLSYGK